MDKAKLLLFPKTKVVRQQIAPKAVQTATQVKRKPFLIRFSENFIATFLLGILGLPVVIFMGVCWLAFYLFMIASGFDLLWHFFRAWFYTNNPNVHGWLTFSEHLVVIGGIYAFIYAIFSAFVDKKPPRKR